MRHWSSVFWILQTLSDEVQTLLVMTHERTHAGSETSPMHGKGDKETMESRAYKGEAVTQCEIYRNEGLRVTRVM